MSMTTHEDNSSDGNELLERAIEELRAIDPRDDMPREVSDRILTIVDAQGSAPAQTSTADASRRFVMSRIGAIGILVAGVVIAVGIWKNVQPDGPSAGERRAASENATSHPGAALNQRDTGGTSDADFDAGTRHDAEAASTPAGTAEGQDSAQTLNGDEGSAADPESDGQVADYRPALERLNEMVQRGDPEVVPILRRQLVIESEWLAQENKTSRLIQAIDGLGQFGDSHVLDTIAAIYRPQKTVPIVRDSAAMAIARIGTSSELELLKTILWDARLSIRSRCESAVTLLKLDVSEAAEFLLAQYDLYRLERHMVSSYHLDPVREALERLGNDQFLIALDERLKNERDLRMQNNIRTLKERMSLNRLSLDELRRVAANPDWKAGMYRRYSVMQVLGVRGGSDLIPFLEALKPWQTDFEGYRKVVEGHNRVFWPAYVAEAIGSIRRRHWQDAAKAEGKQPGSSGPSKSSAAVSKPVELRVLRGHTAPVRRLAVSHDGRYLVSVAYGHWQGSRRSTNEWIVWNLETGKIVHRNQDPRQKLVLQFRVMDATFLPQAYSVVSVGQEHAVWDAPTGKTIRRFPNGRNVPSSFCLSLSPDGKRAVCSRPGVGQITYWETSTGTEHRVKAPDARLAAFLPDGRLLLSCGESGNRLRLFDVDRETVGDLFKGKTSTMTRIRISPDGKMAATISPGVGLWDIPGQELKAQMRRPAGGVCFSPDSRQLIFGGNDGRLSVVRCDTGAELLRFTAQRDVIHAVAYLPDGQHVLTAGGGGFPARANEPTADYAVRLWHLPQL